MRAQPLVFSAGNYERTRNYQFISAMVRRPDCCCRPAHLLWNLQSIANRNNRRAPDHGLFHNRRQLARRGKGGAVCRFRKKSSPLPEGRKTAYLACVFTCDGGKTTWVGYLERYTPEKLHQIQNSTSASDQAQSMANMQSSMQGIQIKRPGDLNWTDCGDIGRSIRITDVRCPDGSHNNLTMVTP
jgi:hypothetical protein